MLRDSRPDASQYAGEIPNGRTIEILDGRRYQGWGGSGTYTYDAAGGRLQWTAGPLAAQGVRVTYAAAQATLTVVGGAASSDPEGTDRCVRR